MQQRPIDVLKQLQSKIRLQTEQDYIDNNESFDSNIVPENQFEKFEFYLDLYKKENALCCPKHAPLEKVIRSSKVMNSGIILNILL